MTQINRSSIIHRCHPSSLLGVHRIVITSWFPPQYSTSLNVPSFFFQSLPTSAFLLPFLPTLDSGSLSPFAFPFDSLILFLAPPTTHHFSLICFLSLPSFPSHQPLPFFPFSLMSYAFPAIMSPAPFPFSPYSDLRNIHLFPP